MRMWNVPVATLCRRHLLGEHVEMHMFAGSLRRGRSIAGHVVLGQVEPHNIQKRHDVLAQEMLQRGYRHNSPLQAPVMAQWGRVSVVDNLAELRRRCVDCRALQGGA